MIRDGVTRIGRNRFSVEFDTTLHANSCLSHHTPVTAQYSAVIPSFSASRMGIIRNISTEWSMEDVVENISIPEDFDHVIKARHLRRKIFGKNHSPVWIPTRPVVLAFSGRSLPRRVYCFYNIPETILSVPGFTYLRGNRRVGHDDAGILIARSLAVSQILLPLIVISLGKRCQGKEYFLSIYLFSRSYFIPLYWSWILYEQGRPG